MTITRKSIRHVKLESRADPGSSQRDWMEGRRREAVTEGLRIGAESGWGWLLSVEYLLFPGNDLWKAGRDRGPMLAGEVWQ